jgi:ABC-2 type transport system permease protein
VQEQLAPEFYTDKNLVSGVLLEGAFPSVFKNRLVRQSLGKGLPMDTLSKPTAQIVLADGDLIRNQVQGGQALPLGFDKYAQQTFGNGDYLLNCMEYLLGQGDVMQVRSRSLALRLLNPDKVKKERNFWRWVNVLSPLLLVAMWSISLVTLRRYRYIKPNN